ncbi:MAG: DEAD/DEAH box helicase [Desulfotomaculum sp.]|nr:DEAD/DEAH box helicase [Desulfotomaculum sp.]
MNYLVHQEFDKIKSIISKDQLTIEECFKIFSWVNRISQDKENYPLAQDILLRCLDKHYIIPGDVKPILFDLVEKLGYFPYLDLKDHSVSAKMALHYEFYRSDNLHNVIMHKEQAEIYDKIISGKSVILSAPTSFGKSLIIEEIVASKRFDNIVIIVPTLALVDEIRQKLSAFSSLYKLIFTTKQKFENKNILILTPERFIELESLPEVDFFIIDEFYKLNDADEESNRINVLNHAFYKLLKMTRSFYLLGPNIASIPANFTEDYKCEFISTNYSTVTCDEVLIERNPEDELQQLTDLLSQLTEPTLIYCKSPQRAETCTKFFVENAVRESLYYMQKHKDLINWIKKNIHPDWSLVKALMHGVAFHHGQMPRHLGRYIVSEFNKGTITYLFCTSTLIEGINTVAKNVVVFDNKKGRKLFSYFDYRNICGRSGRMGQHFLGKVFTFYPPPEKSDVHVDFPWYTQVAASSEILIQMDDDDLKPDSVQKIKEFKNQQDLDVEVIKRNSNVSVSGQISLARKLKDEINKYHELLAWSGYPTYKQLVTCCELIWEFLCPPQGQISGVSSGRQLAYYVNQYYKAGSTGDFVRKILSKDRYVRTVDEAVQKAMTIIRTWFDFKLPKLLLALEQIQKDVFQSRGMRAGDYKFFASRIESGFCHPILSSLQEFGIPTSVSRRLEPFLTDLDNDDLDDVIRQIRRLDLAKINLDPFELKLLNDFINI